MIRVSSEFNVDTNIMVQLLDSELKAFIRNTCISEDISYDYLEFEYIVVVHKNKQYMLLVKCDDDYISTEVEENFRNYLDNLMISGEDFRDIEIYLSSNISQASCLVVDNILYQLCLDILTSLFNAELAIDEISRNILVEPVEFYNYQAYLCVTRLTDRQLSLILTECNTSDTTQTITPDEDLVSHSVPYNIIQSNTDKYNITPISSQLLNNKLKAVINDVKNSTSTIDEILPSKVLTGTTKLRNELLDSVVGIYNGKKFSKF